MDLFMKRSHIALSMIVIVALSGFLMAGVPAGSEVQNKVEPPKQGGKIMTLSITSKAFTEGGMIPMKYTCDGEDVSPPLAISGVPEKTKSLALISDDPDAPRGTWVHWVLYNLPTGTSELPEKMATKEILESGARHGFTDFGSFGYGGPCPPGGTHRYFFKIYALDVVLNLSGKITKKDLVAAMQGHILAEGQLMGKYKRK